MATLSAEQERLASVADVRRAQVMQWREVDKMTYRLIAQRLGVTRERVRQLYVAGKRRERERQGAR